VEMTYVHLNFLIDSEEHWSGKIYREVRSLKSESRCDDLEYLSFQILWLHLIGSELELQLETIMWHTRLLRKLCIYFAIGYVVVLIFFNYLFDVTKVCVCWKVFNTNFFQVQIQKPLICRIADLEICHQKNHWSGVWLYNIYA
jgi:hypothetical protein